MEKVLCATDHSKASQKAEVFAANLAHKVGADLIYVFVSHITVKDMEPKASRSSITILKDVALQEHDVLAHAKAVANDIGVSKVRGVLLRSHKIASKIIDYAKQEKVDHIVVGTAGNQGLKRLALGSVADKIIARTDCPVTVIR
jgi:nucleotide-binding universal stress UspA family protein